MKVDWGMLADYGGPVKLTKGWAQSLMERMGFVECQGTTKTKVLAENFEAFKEGIPE